jgi:hypothetical protein
LKKKPVTTLAPQKKNSSKAEGQELLVFLPTGTLAMGGKGKEGKRLREAASKQKHSDANLF